MNFATSVFSVIFAINTDQFPQGLTDWFAWARAVFAVRLEMNLNIIVKNPNL